MQIKTESTLRIQIIQSRDYRSTIKAKVKRQKRLLTFILTLRPAHLVGQNVNQRIYGYLKSAFAQGKINAPLSGRTSRSSPRAYHLFFAFSFRPDSSRARDWKAQPACLSSAQADAGD
jgi:hypothetical protein